MPDFRIVCLLPCSFECPVSLSIHSVTATCSQYSSAPWGSGMVAPKSFCNTHNSVKRKTEIFYFVTAVLIVRNGANYELHLVRSLYAFYFLFVVWQPSWARASLCGGFAITLRHTTLGRTPLDGWLDLRRDLYLKTHNSHMRKTSMFQAGFEPAIPISQRP